MPKKIIQDSHLRVQLTLVAWRSTDLWDFCKLSYSTILYHNEFWLGVAPPKVHSPPVWHAQQLAVPQLPWGLYQTSSSSRTSCSLQQNTSAQLRKAGNVDSCRGGMKRCKIVEMEPKNQLKCNGMRFKKGWLFFTPNKTRVVTSIAPGWKTLDQFSW